MQCWRRLRLECAEASSDKVSLLCDHLPRIYLSNLSNCQPLSLSLSLSLDFNFNPRCYRSPSSRRRWTRGP